MGDSVNLASRLEGANKYYDTLILLGPRTYELAAQDIEAREVDRLCVKGKKEPVVVFELLARRGCLSAKQHRVIKTYVEGLEAYKHRDFKTAQRNLKLLYRLILATARRGFTWNAPKSTLWLLLPPTGMESMN